MPLNTIPVPPFNLVNTRNEKTVILEFIIKSMIQDKMNMKKMLKEMSKVVLKHVSPKKRIE